MSDTKKIQVEYIWLDGSKPQKLRSKTKIINSKLTLTNTNILDIDLPNWNYDGSSTKQADTNDSEIILVPRSRFLDPFDGHLLVMCDTYHVDMTPTDSNKRSILKEVCDEKDSEQTSWYGFEQEYIMKNNETHTILGWPPFQESYPLPQGDYYCGAGAKNVKGRDIAFEHLSKCLEAGLEISGVNAEVMLGQWEYQIGPVTALQGSDQMWMSRYILYRIGEKYNVEMVIEPKPVKSDDWNGSGMHVNFSTLEMRDKNNIESGKSIELIEEACEKLGKKHDSHIKHYGEDNEDRLTGSNETASYKEFSWGYGDRTASIRIPYAVKDKTAGYLEDRRPGSNADPYIIVTKLLKTIC